MSANPLKRRYRNYIKYPEFKKKLIFAVLILAVLALTWPTLFATVFYGLFGVGRHPIRRALKDVPIDVVMCLFNLAMLKLCERIRVKQGEGRPISFSVLIPLSLLLQINAEIFDARLLSESGYGMIVQMGNSPWALDILTLFLASAALLLMPASKQRGYNIS